MVKGGENSQVGAVRLRWQGAKGGLNRGMARAGGRVGGQVGGHFQLQLQLVV